MIIYDIGLYMSKLYIVKYIEGLKAKIDRTVNKIYDDFPELIKYPQLNHNKKEIGRLLVDKRMFGIMLYENNKLMGYIVGETMVLPDGRLIYFITYLYVDHEHRNIGLGKYLLNNMIKHIMNYGIYVMVLMADENDKGAQKFYSKFGFEVDDYLIRHQRVGPYVPLSKYLTYV
jgi:ribosomal protein S18 acetylase RimI-like enzyme